MRVWFEDAWDGVKVAYTASRYKVSGKVTYNGSASSNDKIRLWLDDKIEASVDINGAYQFEVKEGSYVLAPRLGPIKDGCMTFSPAERILLINGSNVTGQDFIIAGEPPCYTIQGSVSADNNPGYYADYSDEVGLISRVYIYDNGKQNQLTSAWIDYDGYYKFEYIPVGFYVLTPSVSYWASGIFGIPMYGGTPGHDTSIFVTSNRWVNLYLDF